MGARQEVNPPDLELVPVSRTFGASSVVDAATAHKVLDASLPGNTLMKTASS